MPPAKKRRSSRQRTQIKERMREKGLTHQQALRELRVEGVIQDGVDGVTGRRIEHGRDGSRTDS